MATLGRFGPVMGMPTFANNPVLVREIVILRRSATRPRHRTTGPGARLEMLMARLAISPKTLQAHSHCFPEQCVVLVGTY